ncbi:DnaJ domain-containing protein, partial [Tanacetum coccineum]
MRWDKLQHNFQESQSQHYQDQQPEKDYYRILEVDYEAMDEEIRSNFIRVAMVCEFSATVATSVDNVGVAEVSSFGGRTLYATRYRIKVSNPISSNILTLRCAVELALRFSTLDDALEVG